MSSTAPAACTPAKAAKGGREARCLGCHRCRGVVGQGWAPAAVGVGKGGTRQLRICKGGEGVHGTHTTHLCLVSGVCARMWQGVRDLGAPPAEERRQLCTSPPDHLLEGGPCLLSSPAYQLYALHGIDQPPQPPPPLQVTSLQFQTPPRTKLMQPPASEHLPSKSRPRQTQTTSWWAGQTGECCWCSPRDQGRARE